MKKIIYCVICGSYTDYSAEYAKELERHGKTCPECRTIGSLCINQLNEDTNEVMYGC